MFVVRVCGWLCVTACVRDDNGIVTGDALWLWLCCCEAWAAARNPAKYMAFNCSLFVSSDSGLLLNASVTATLIAALLSTPGAVAVVGTVGTGAGAADWGGAVLERTDCGSNAMVAKLRLLILSGDDSALLRGVVGGAGGTGFGANKVCAGPAGGVDDNVWLWFHDDADADANAGCMTGMWVEGVGAGAVDETGVTSDGIMSTIFVWLSWPCCICICICMGMDMCISSVFIFIFILLPFTTPLIAIALVVWALTRGMQGSSPFDESCPAIAITRNYTLSQ